MLPVVQGRVGLVNAIKDLTELGHVVSLPLIDNQCYDLVADIDGKLLRVEIKTTSVITPTGPDVQLKRVRPNTSNNVIHKFNNSVVDFVYVYCTDGRSWFIPSSEVKAGCCIRLGTKYNKWRVGGMVPERS